MALHIIKLCVGAQSIDDHANWQQNQLAMRKTLGLTPRITHTTGQMPKRVDDVLDGGSLYWVIKGVIQVRQRIIGLEGGQREDGRTCCHIVLDPEIVPVRPARRRPFQGWRYLTADDAPGDFGSASNAASVASMSPKMRKDLAELGLL
jgi:hypothetical protein